MFRKYGLLLEFLQEKEAVAEFKSAWKPLIRLPAVLSDQQSVVLPISECRDERQRALVEGVLGIVTIPVNQSLQEMFGWTEILDPLVIGKRIDHLVSNHSSWPSTRKAIFTVLDYINSNVRSLGDKLADYISTVQSHLTIESWVPGSAEGFWPLEKIFLEGADDFSPYIANVPKSYRQFAEILYLFGLTNSPTSQTLLDIFPQLPSGKALNSMEMHIVIRILKSLESMEEREETQLRVPDLECRLCQINEFSIKNASKQRFVHPTVPRAFALKYSLPQDDEDSAFLQHLNQDDEIEDFVQMEEMTTRITTTLKAYSISTSFNEFVANAEDCGSATRISWLLDDEHTSFPTESLFTQELIPWQTASLYVYNDGVFTESDFNAFRKVGTGTKANDSTKIGRYGLGALTMYHFTDVPSMVSGKYFIIFDPSSRYLPVAPGKKHRRPGMRIPLSIMKVKFIDHLVPFIGIEGFSLGIFSIAGLADI